MQVLLMSLLGPNTCRFLVPFGFHSGLLQNKNYAWQVNSESGLSYVPKNYKLKNKDDFEKCYDVKKDHH